MATKYNLFIEGVEIPEATRAKKAAVIKIGEASKKSFEVKTDTGTVVHSTVAVKPSKPTETEKKFMPSPDQGQATRTGASSKSKVDPETIANEVTSRDFPGNYSIVMIPFVRNVAAAYGGVEVREERFPGKLVRRAHLGGTEINVKAFVKILDQLTADVMDDLKIWQKDNVEKRKGQTDMQKFLGNRQFIQSYGERAAKRIKAGEIS